MTANTPPPPRGVQTERDREKPWWRRWWGLALIALATLLVVAVTAYGA